MALPSSGVMKASMIQAELGESGSWSINSQSSRALAKVPSGTIKFSDFYGKSKEITEIVANFTIGRYKYKPSAFKTRYVDGLYNDSTYTTVTKGVVTIVSDDTSVVTRLSHRSRDDMTSSLTTTFYLHMNADFGSKCNVVIDGIGSWIFNKYGTGEYKIELPSNVTPLYGFEGQTKRLTITKLYYNLVQLLREVI